MQLKQFIDLLNEWTFRLSYRRFRLLALQIASCLTRFSSTGLNPTVYKTSLLAVYLLCEIAAVGHTQTPAQGDDQHKYTNALAKSNSPYLLQHAHNPVNWYTWSKEAFDKARRENKPIFVSVGYSTCYWCHVMERESFENEKVAAVLNEHYVAIKVDREQRPDIDEQLMLATQLFSGRGGWPNSIWLTSDGRPWMAGTYFPKEPFIDALSQLAKIWEDEPDKVDAQANSFVAAMREAMSTTVESSQTEPTEAPLERALRELTTTYDREFGGFGTQPKFPPHSQLAMLAWTANRGDAKSLEMLTLTLDAIWCGGIHDHVGGGFHRYSTDRHWLLPHFEKMLYDNAQLMLSFTAAHQLTGRPLYRAAVDDIHRWLTREMTSAEGGFYSALDSESDGVEGQFYTWTISELQSLLGKRDAQLIEEHYQLRADGNFSEEASGHRNGRNIPHLGLTSIRNDRPTVDQTRLADLRAKLLQQRNLRGLPHLDDKVLTGWNGLMIGALAIAAREFNDERYEAAASRAASLVLDRLFDSERRLLRTYRRGQASIPAFLEDYAFLGDGFIELHETTGEPKWLAEAEFLAQEMKRLFEDTQAGGFYFTGSDQEQLLIRSKNLLGGGNLPSGNGVAANLLLKLFSATGDAQYLAEARRTILAFDDLIRSAPRQAGQLVLAHARLAEIDKGGVQPDNQ